MQVLQSLANDNLFHIIKQIIFLLHRLWESRNTILHQGRTTSVISDMKHIHNYYSFHVSFAGADIRKKATEKRRFSYKAPTRPPNAPSNYQHEWLLIMGRCNTLIGKPCLCIIFYRSEVLIKMMFRKSSSMPAPFLHCCLRSVLAWVLSSNLYTANDGCLLVLDSPSSLSQVWNPDQNTILKDICQMISRFEPFDTCSREDHPWADNHFKFSLTNEDPHIFLTI